MLKIRKQNEESYDDKMARNIDIILGLLIFAAVGIFVLSVLGTIVSHGGALIARYANSEKWLAVGDPVHAVKENEDGNLELDCSADDAKNIILPKIFIAGVPPCVFDAYTTFQENSCTPLMTYLVASKICRMGQEEFNQYLHEHTLR